MEVAPLSKLIPLAEVGAANAVEAAMSQCLDIDDARRGDAPNMRMSNLEKSSIDGGRVLTTQSG